MSSSDSDSSSENELNQFKEAVDTQFLKDEFYNPEKKRKIAAQENIEEKKSLPSLRNAEKEDYSWNPYNIRVTPEFRSYVAKQLTKVLDKTIDDSEAFQEPAKSSQESSGGIKLLSSSKKLLNLKNTDHSSEIVTRKKVKIKKRKCDDDRDTDSSEEEKRVKEAAVSPEWILSGEETKHWAPVTKGEVEIIQTNSKKKKRKKKKKKDLVNGKKLNETIVKNE